jgi:hypothetical protein
MHNALKLFCFMVASSNDVLPAVEEGNLPCFIVENDINKFAEEAGSEVEITHEMTSEAATLLTERLPLFTLSVHLEVQERACFVLEILNLYNSLKDNENTGTWLLSHIFSVEKK